MGAAAPAGQGLPCPAVKGDAKRSAGTARRRQGWKPDRGETPQAARDVQHDSPAPKEGRPGV